MPHRDSTEELMRRAGYAEARGNLFKGTHAGFKVLAKYASHYLVEYAWTLDEAQIQQRRAMDNGASHATIYWKNGQGRWLEVGVT